MRSLACLSLISLLALSTTSCASSPVSEQEKRCREVARNIVSVKEDIAISYIERNGMTHRISRRDGQSFMGTHDYNPDRVNLVIEKGRVISITCN